MDREAMAAVDVDDIEAFTRQLRASAASGSRR